MSEKSVKVSHIVPYSSPATFSDSRTVNNSGDSADTFSKKENPRIVRFVTGGGRKTKKKNRSMK